MGSHVGASFVSLAPTFFKSQSALTSLLLLCAKGHARLACSVASVLAMARCRYQPFAGSSPTLKDGMAYLLPPIYASEQNPFAPAYFYLRKMHIFRPSLCSAPLILKFFFNHIRSTNTVSILDNMDYFVSVSYTHLDVYKRQRVVRCWVKSRNERNPYR